MCHSQNATRSLVMMLFLAVGLAACSHSNSPSEFNAQGVAADMSTAQTAFDSPVSASFDAAGQGIAAALGQSAAAVISPGTPLVHPAAAAEYARSLTRLLPKAGGVSADVVAIPAAARGKTFVWDLGTGAYVASELAGAPATGVRFLLYAVNPVTREPADPLQELGFVDVIDVSVGATKGTRVLVSADGVTYFDYSVSGTGTSASGTLSVVGFASNGVSRVNFNLQNTVAQTVNGAVLTLDYSLAIPSRGLQVSYTATFGNIAPQQVAVTLDFSVSGRNGDVRLSGTYGAAGGSFSLRVNGEVFATVTLSNGAPVITTATGAALTAGEEAAFESILAFYDGSLGVFADLLSPVS